MKVAEIGLIGVVGPGSRFVAKDSLSILEMHRVGLISNPVLSSLQNTCTVLGEELETN